MQSYVTCTNKLTNITLELLNQVLDEFFVSIYTGIMEGGGIFCVSHICVQCDVR